MAHAEGCLGGGGSGLYQEPGELTGRLTLFNDDVIPPCASAGRSSVRLRFASLTGKCAGAET